MISPLLLMGICFVCGVLLVALVGTVELAKRRRRILAGVAALAAVVVVLGSAAAAGPLLFPCGPRGCDLKAGIEYARRRTRILDRNGEFIGIREPGRAPWVPLGVFPEHVRAAVIQREDRRFGAHGGVDIVGVLGAVRSHLRGGRRGASTIAMQVAQLTVGEFGLRQLPPDGTLRGKLAESAVAARLLLVLGRDGVLEIYLNSVPMGAVWGFEGAARREFGVGIEEVTVAEGSTLAAMIRAPSALSPCNSSEEARRERDDFIRELLRRGVADAGDAERWAAEPLVASCPPRGPSDDALLAVRRTLTEASVNEVPGDSIRTTIDMVLQRRAWVEAEHVASEVQARARGKRVQSLVVVLGPRGEIRALVSGRPGLARGYDRTHDARIRYGSTLKPLLLASALERGLVSADEKLDDVEGRLVVDLSDPWLSRIRSGANRQRTVRDALAHSENWLAVLLWHLLPEFEMERVRAAGWPVPDLTYPPSALGTGVVEPLMLAAAYASLGDDGRLYQPTLVQIGQPEAPLLWREGTVALMRDMLHGVVLTGTAHGATSVAGGARLAGKTGTTADTSGNTLEAVIVGFDTGGPEARTALLWVGHDAPAPLMARGSAGSLLAAHWAGVFSAGRH